MRWEVSTPKCLPHHSNWPWDQVESNTRMGAAMVHATQLFTQEPGDEQLRVIVRTPFDAEPIPENPRYVPGAVAVYDIRRRFSLDVQELRTYLPGEDYAAELVGF